VLANTSGFVYYVSITGVTGTATPNAVRVASAVERIKRHTTLPVVVGFGVKSPDQAEVIGRDADGVVVGSALVDAVRRSLDADNRATSETVSVVTRLVADIAAGVRRAKEGIPA